ncbi:MAG: DinB family protein [Candidatus Rokuibacteriota bacterium]
MVSKRLESLKSKNDAAWAELTGQLQDMEPHLERSDAPGQWTTRQVLCHLLSAPGRSVEAALQSFAEEELPLIDIQPGQAVVTDDRRRMTLRQLIDALDAQRRSVFAYLARLPEDDLERRKARIPLFKQFMGTDEIALGPYVGAMFDFHWRDHAGQLAKIRKAAGLPGVNE